MQNCLGALDGTYIKVNVLEADKPRYRTRKGEIATNVLGVCSQDMQFIYVLPGWEGLASDARVLRDVVSRTNGLKVPQGIVNMQFKVIIFCVTNKLFIVAYFTLGFYYLCDAGYMNGEGFLAPYRG